MRGFFYAPYIHDFKTSENPVVLIDKNKIHDSFAIYHKKEEQSNVQRV